MGTENDKKLNLKPLSSDQFTTITQLGKIYSTQPSTRTRWEIGKIHGGAIEIFENLWKSTLPLSSSVVWAPLL